MNKNSLPTSQDIEQLTAYLPRLYAEGFSAIAKWEGGETLKDGSFTLPYPKYDPLVEEFFQAVAQSWLDHEYNPGQAYQMLRDEQVIRTASLAQIKTILTLCVRGERLSDGHWGEMIEKGYIRRILERLNEIRSEMK
jgi:hypothetical protein